jgi:hypothetical protein
LKRILSAVTNLLPVILAWTVTLYAYTSFQTTRNDTLILLTFLIILCVTPFYAAVRFFFLVQPMAETSRREDYYLATIPPLYLFRRVLLKPFLWSLAPLTASFIPLTRFIDKNLVSEFVLLALAVFISFCLIFTGFFDGLCHHFKNNPSEFPKPYLTGLLLAYAWMVLFVFLVLSIAQEALLISSVIAIICLLRLLFALNNSIKQVYQFEG